MIYSSAQMPILLRYSYYIQSQSNVLRASPIWAIVKIDRALSYICYAWFIHKLQKYLDPLQ